MPEPRTLQMHLHPWRPVLAQLVCASVVRAPRIALAVLEGAGQMLVHPTFIPSYHDQCEAYAAGTSHAGHTPIHPYTHSRFTHHLLKVHYNIHNNNYNRSTSHHHLGRRTTPRMRCASPVGHGCARVLLHQRPALQARESAPLSRSSLPMDAGSRHCATVPPRHLATVSQGRLPCLALLCLALLVPRVCKCLVGSVLPLRLWLNRPSGGLFFWGRMHHV